jgi:hypothetical protein
MNKKVAVVYGMLEVLLKMKQIIVIAYKLLRKRGKNNGTI